MFKATLGLNHGCTKVPTPALALTFELFFPRKHRTCDHPVSSSPSSAVKQKDTDTTSGSGSPEAANCRKLSEYNVESITLVWPSPCIPPEQLPSVLASRRILAETDRGSEPRGALVPPCVRVPCPCCPVSVGFVERAEVATKDLAGFALCLCLLWVGGCAWCTPKG